MILYHDDVNGIGTQEQRPWSYKITRKWVLPDHNIDHGKHYTERTLSPYVKIRNNVPNVTCQIRQRYANSCSKKERTCENNKFDE